MIIAQQFTAGDRGNQYNLRPVGTLERLILQHVSIVPPGRKNHIPHFHHSDESLGYYQTTLRVGTSANLCVTTRALPI
jgi:hypothetical protein